MDTESTRPADFPPALVDTTTLERYREAVQALRQAPDDGSTEERVGRARAAMSGVRFGAPLMPSHHG